MGSSPDGIELLSRGRVPQNSSKNFGLLTTYAIKLVWADSEVLYWRKRRKRERETGYLGRVNWHLIIRGNLCVRLRIVIAFLYQMRGQVAFSIRTAIFFLYRQVYATALSNANEIHVALYSMYRSEMCIIQKIIYYLRLFFLENNTFVTYLSMILRVILSRSRWVLITHTVI